MDRVSAADRQGSLARDRLAARATSFDIHLRPYIIRRNGRNELCGARIRNATNQDRTIRPDRRCMMEELDGNAAAGLLQEIFPFEMTLAHTTCAGCGRLDAIGVLAAYLHGMGTILRCPSC